MLTAVLLCCALLLALPAMQGAQMGLAPLEGIRRPDQAPLPELPGQCGQGWVCVGLDTFWSQIILPGMHPPSPSQSQAWEVGVLCMGGFCSHIICYRPGTEAWAEKDN